MKIDDGDHLVGAVQRSKIDDVENIHPKKIALRGTGSFRVRLLQRQREGDRRRLAHDDSDQNPSSTQGSKFNSGIDVLGRDRSRRMTMQKLGLNLYGWILCVCAF
jgi:hypothetical protein